MTTPITQLMVHIDPSAHSAQRLALACNLAKRHGSSITALYAATPRYVDLPFAPDIGPSVVMSMRQMDESFRTQARAEFDRFQASMQSSSGVQMTRAQVDKEPMMAEFALQALYADLLVLGQRDPASKHTIHMPGDFVESAIAMSGKPALVLPFIGAPSSLTERVVIAWKPTREAARAVSAAVPLLQAAKEVHVVTWGTDGAAALGGRLDLKKYLALRGIQAAWHAQGDEPNDIGEMLLSRVFDFQADLLVMGCYGHSRPLEWVLGGVSRTILQAMTVPVLMAH